MLSSIPIQTTSFELSLLDVNALKHAARPPQPYCMIIPDSTAYASHFTHQFSIICRIQQPQLINLVNVKLYEHLGQFFRTEISHLIPVSRVTELSGTLSFIPLEKPSFTNWRVYQKHRH